MVTLHLNGVAVGEIPVTGDPEVDAARTRDFLASNGLRKRPDMGRAMLSQAIAFDNLARRTYDVGLSKVPADGLALAPFVVNSAFAIEIYLKTLAFLFGAPIRGHELLQLYDGLPNDAKDLVLLQTAAYRAKDGEAINLDIRSYLCDVNNAFVQWRYYYENDQTLLIHPFDIYVVLDVLHSACAEHVST